MREMVCPQCNAPVRPMQTFCSGKCRTAACRQRRAPAQAARVFVNTRYQQNKRLCQSPVSAPRDVGRDGDLRKLQAIENECRAARKALREEFAKDRERYLRGIRRILKSNRLLIKEIRAHLKEMTPALKRAIDLSEFDIRRKYGNDRENITVLPETGTGAGTEVRHTLSQD
jgi:hypothetical protein